MSLPECKLKALILRRTRRCSIHGLFPAGRDQAPCWPAIAASPISLSRSSTTAPPSPARARTGGRELSWAETAEPSLQPQLGASESELLPGMRSSSAARAQTAVARDPAGAGPPDGRGSGSGGDEVPDGRGHASEPVGKLLGGVASSSPFPDGRHAKSQF